MIQVWEIDNSGYFTGKSYFVEKALENHVINPLLVGYVKAKWTGSEWIEGATEVEIETWNQANKIDICDEKPTPEEQLMDMAKMILDLQYQIDVLTLLNQEG